MDLVQPLEAILAEQEMATQQSLLAEHNQAVKPWFEHSQVILHKTGLLVRAVTYKQDLENAAINLGTALRVDRRESSRYQVAALRLIREAYEIARRMDGNVSTAHLRGEAWISDR